MKKRITTVILSILIFSFSVINCYAGVTPRAISRQYTIEEILNNGYIGYISDTHYDNSFNLLTYLNYLNTDEGHPCSTFNQNYCKILEYYKSFLSDYAEVGDAYNYYVLTDLRTDKYKTYYILSEKELYYYTDGANHYLKIDSGDIRYFLFNGSFESAGYIIPWNFSQYSDADTYFNIGGTSSNILLSNVDVKDNNGNVIFESNVIIEEPEPEPEGSDVTLGGISNIIDGVKDGLTDLKNTITDFIKDLTAPLEFLKERFQSSTIITGITGVIEYITNFFAEASDGMLIIKEFFAMMPDKFIYFFWGPFVVLLIVSFVGRLLH